jgi:alkanesulfonate monooxygenase SsuD/methylene tetrahydromethanopterin reductase-like flavin-dependent oxidoreductase (luciferase family)
MRRRPRPRPADAVDVGVALWSMQATAAAPAAHVDLYRAMLDDARLVEALGYHCMWFAEHRFWYDGWCPSPLVAAAAAAGVTDTLRVGTAMLLLPQHDPARVAGILGELDRLSGGRLEAGLGLGHRDAEFDGLGLERRQRGARMEAGLDVVLGRMAASQVWIGGMADAALRRGARRGLSFLLPQTLYPDEIAAVRDRIHTEAAAAGASPGRIGVLRDAWVETDGDAARRLVLPRLVDHYREEAGSWWVLRGALGFAHPELLERQLGRVTGTALVGTPDEVVAGVLALRDAGADTVVLRFGFDVTRTGLRDALRLFAEAGLPNLRATA